MSQHLIKATDLALSGAWDEAHEIVQEMNGSFANWIHAVLHKIEGDEWNSRYWYARTTAKYEDFVNPTHELQAIRQQLLAAQQ